MASLRVATAREGQHWTKQRLCALSTTLENEAIATVENEATQTDWVGDLSGGLGSEYEQNPDFLHLLPAVERTGQLPPVVPNGFVAHTHRPSDLADEVSEAGLQIDDLVGVEGLPLAGTDMQCRVGDQMAWNVVLDAARAIERVPELLGLSPHLIATATRAPG